MGYSEFWVENLKDDPGTSSHIRKSESSQRCKSQQSYQLGKDRTV